MVSILEKLSVRMMQRQKKNAASWSQFVSDIVDEKLKDADEILAALEVLNKSPEDLQRACELLVQRREWSAVVAAGDSAEAEYPKLTQQAADAEQALKKLIEAHHAKYAPLGDKIERARDAIGAAADARRRLLETCSANARTLVTSEIDGQIQETGKELDSVRKSIRDCERWVTEVSSNGDSAATSDQKRLESQQVNLKELRKNEATLSGKLSSLQDDRGKASAALIKPEAI